MDEEKLLELLQRLFEKLGGSPASKAKIDDLKKETDAAKRHIKLMELVNDSFSKYNKQIKDSTKKFTDISRALSEFDDLIKEAVSDSEKLEIAKKKETLASEYLTKQYKEAGKSIREAIVGGLGKGMVDATKNLVRNLQSGGSGISLAADLMSTALDTNQQFLTAGARSGQALGQSMALLGPKFAKQSMALSVGSVALEQFSLAVTSAAKEGIQLLAAEADKTIKAFNTVTASGALFARGMDDLRLYSSRAGLTVDQFANVIKNNSGLLAEAGYTVADGAKIVGNVTSRFAVQFGKSGQTLQRELLNLGYGFEEQANLTAEIVSDLKKTGGMATNGQLAAATVEMAKNTRAMADIMGEEFKARQDAAKKDMEQYAFQAKIREQARRTNDPTLLKRAEIALAGMTDSQRRLAIQNYVLEGAMTDVPGLLIDGGRAAGIFGNALRAGHPSLEQLTQGTVELNDRMQNGTDEMGNAISRWTIATGQGAEFAKAWDDQYRDSNKMNSENRTKALQAAGELAGATGGLQGELIGVEIQAQKLKIAIQEVLTPTIDKFGKVANEVLDGVSKAVENFTGKKKDPRWYDDISADITKIGIGTMIAGGVVAAGSIAAAPFTGGASLAGLAPAATLLGVGSTTATVGGVGTAMGFDRGGIADGPLSGYSTTLHGAEAVVPLPDNRKIPVNLDSSSLTAAINQNSSILSAMLSTMRENNSISSQIVQNTY